MNYAQVLVAFNAQINNPAGNRYIAHRAGWNGANQFIGLCTQWNGNLLTDSPDFEIMPFTYIKTAQNKIVPWVPSQTDQLADDWEINMVPLEAHSEIPDAAGDALDAPANDSIIGDQMGEDNNVVPDGLAEPNKDE